MFANTEYQTIERAPNRRHYTVIDNQAIRDKRLSFKARGIHHLLLSYPDGWVVNVNHLVGECPDIRGEGRDGINNALKELEKYGYLTRKQNRNVNGTFSSGHCVVHELPEVNILSSDVPENGLTANGSTGNGSTGTYIISTSKKELKEEKEGEQQNLTQEPLSLSLSPKEEVLPLEEKTHEHPTRKLEDRFKFENLPPALSKTEEQWFRSPSGQKFLKFCRELEVPASDWKGFFAYLYKKYLCDYTEGLKPSQDDFNLRLRNYVSNKLKDADGCLFIKGYLEAYAQQKPLNPEIKTQPAQTKSEPKPTNQSQSVLSPEEMARKLASKQDLMNNLLNTIRGNRNERKLGFS